MLVNEFINGSLALLIAYLLGSIPAAYIITRLATGKDIRKLGNGNVDARNVYHEVGLIAGIVTAAFDVAKGAGAVLIAVTLLGEPAWWFADASAEWLSSAPAYFVLASGLAAVIGHIWSIYLGFNGGSGLTTAIGVLSIVMTQEILLASAVTMILILVIRNPILCVNISLLIVPLTGWYLENSWLMVTFSVVLLLIMAVHFLPTARVALGKAGSWNSLIDELLRREKKRQKVKQKVVK